MNIVVDANIIIREAYGTSSRFQFFLSLAGVLAYNLYVPALVVEEVVAHFKRELNDIATKTRSSISTLNRLLSRDLHSPVDNFDLEREARLFRERLQSMFVETNCSLLDYPDLPHKELVRRATERRRPFNENGSGYRDSLIWESMLALVAYSDTPAVLISADKIFSNDKGKLHSDLVRDMLSRGQSTLKVKLACSLADFIDEYVRPNLKKVMEANPMQALNDRGISLDGEIKSSVERIYASKEWEADQLRLPWDYEGLLLTSVEDVDDLAATDIREVDEDTLLLEVGATLSCIFDVFVSKWEAYLDEDLDIIEPDWNKHYVWASISLVLNVTLDFLVDISDPKDVSVEMLSMDVESSDRY